MKNVTITVEIERIVEKLLASWGASSFMCVLDDTCPRLPVPGEGRRGMLASVVWLQTGRVAHATGSSLKKIVKEGEMSAQGSVTMTLSVMSGNASQITSTAGEIIEDLFYLGAMEQLLYGVRRESWQYYEGMIESRSGELRRLLNRIAPGRYRHRLYW